MKCMKYLSQPAVAMGQLCQGCINSSSSINNFKMAPQPRSSDSVAKNKQSLALMRAKEILAKSKTEAEQLSSSQQSISTAIVSNKPLPADTPSLSDPYETARSKRVSPLPYPTGLSRNPRSSKTKAPTTSKGAIPSSNPPAKVIVQCGFEVRAGGKFHTKLSEL